MLWALGLVSERARFSFSLRLCAAVVGRGAQVRCGSGWTDKRIIARDSPRLFGGRCHHAVPQRCRGYLVAKPREPKAVWCKQGPVGIPRRIAWNSSLCVKWLVFDGEIVRVVVFFGACHFLEQLVDSLGRCIDLPRFVISTSSVRCR